MVSVLRHQEALIVGIPYHITVPAGAPKCQSSAPRLLNYGGVSPAARSGAVTRTCACYCSQVSTPRPESAASAW